MSRRIKHDYAWFIFAILIGSILACAGSESRVLRLNLTSREKGSLSVMPFNTTFERKYHSDAHTRASFGLLMGLIAHAINERSGIYTYTFDDKDLMNLRTSIVNSLRAARYFDAVNDIPVLNENVPDKGIRLYIDFKSMGVSQTAVFICEINAHARVCDISDKVLAEKNINVREKGVMTLMAAKNNAIDKFIREIATLLNSV